jgi:hypothetical protein
MRDEFSKESRRVIAARVGWRCSNPRCRAFTEGPNADEAKSTSTGIAAHITAASPKGPRYDLSLTAEARGDVSNGIWLCETCARLIDSDNERFAVGLLRCWKTDSEDLTRREIESPRTPSVDLQPIRYSAVGIAEECLWWPAHRLQKVQLNGGLRPDFGFHEIPPLAWEGTGKSPDRNISEPILDVTLINDGTRSGTATAMGVELVCTWTAMKGLPVAQKIHPTDVYVLKLIELIPGEPQMSILRDPVGIPSGGVFRYQLWLEDFASAAQNECLVRLVVEFEGRLHRSGMVYLGRY